jgi:hypothetical protein
MSLSRQGSHVTQDPDLDQLPGGGGLWTMYVESKAVAGVDQERESSGGYTRSTSPFTILLLRRTPLDMLESAHQG